MRMWKGVTNRANCAEKVCKTFMRELDSHPRLKHSQASRI